MVNKIFSRLAMLGLLVFFVTSCSKSTDYLEVIPEDASGVVAFDLHSLSNKAGISNSENEQLKFQILDAITSGLNAASKAHVDKILKDPSESGLSLKDKMYIFTTPAHPEPIIMAKVADKRKFRKTVDLMATEQVLEPVTEEGGIAYSMLDRQTILAFSNSALIITPLSGNSQQELINKFLKADNKKNITDNKAFQKMQKRNGDILFYSTMDALPQKYARQLNTGISDDTDMKEVMIAGNVNFEKGKISIQSEIHSDNDKVNELLKNQEKATGKITGNLMANFPDNTLAFFTMNVQGGELYKLLTENEEFRKRLSLSEAAQVKDLFNSFKGDVSIGLINVSMTSSPTFIAYAEADKDVKINTIYDAKNELGLRRGEDIVQLAPDQYVYRSRQGNIFYGYKDKHIYATNDELLYKNALSGNSLKDARYASNIKGNLQYLVIDIEAITQLPIVKLAIAFGGRQASTYFDIASRFSYVEMTGQESGKYDINIVLRDKEENAMKQILDFAKTMSGL